jgi:hypothetical protein
VLAKRGGTADDAITLSIIIIINAVLRKMMVIILTHTISIKNVTPSITTWSIKTPLLRNNKKCDTHNNYSECQVSYS